MSDMVSTFESVSDSIDRAFDIVQNHDDDDISLPNSITTSASADFDADDNAAGKSEDAKRDEALARAEAKVKANAAAKQAANANDKDPKVSGNIVENEKLLKGIIDKSFGASGEKLTTRDLISKEAREHRQALRNRFPGAKLGEIVEIFEKWEAEFKRDPVATREAIMHSYLKLSPQNRSRPVQREYEAGPGGSVERAMEDQRDIEELSPAIEKYGKSFPQLLRQLVEFDAGMIDDPVGTSARLAANYGVLDRDRPQQQQSSHAAANPEEHLANLHKGLELAIENNVLPGLENEDMQEAIAVALENGMIPRTRDRFADLKAAHAYVTKDKKSFDAMLKRGGKSISGGPARQTTPRSKRDSLNDALDTAFAFSSQ